MRNYFSYTSTSYPVGIRIVAASAIVLTLGQPLLAWSEAGHRIIASIAVRQISEKNQHRFAEIMEHHPRFKEDFETPLSKEKDVKSDFDRNDWLLQQASLWPDIVRGFRGELKVEFHRGPWHYINLPIFLNESDRLFFAKKLSINLSMQAPPELHPEMNIIQVIRKSRLMITDPTAAKKDKAVMLAWLCHTVGDIHQPLHSCALFSSIGLPKGDKGGNAIQTKQRGNLHALWDQFPGGNINCRTARNRALKLLSETDITSDAFLQLDEEVWLKESYDAAVGSVYSEEIRVHLNGTVDISSSPLVLSEEYLKHGGNLAHVRLCLAGIRLGRVLELALGE